MTSVLAIIQPYWHEDAWVFDDVSEGLEKEPLEGRFEGELADIMELEQAVFGGGITKMINHLVKDIPNAREGFLLLLSSRPFAGCQAELIRVRAELRGWTYKAKDYRVEPWFPPVMSRYFPVAPELLYVRAEPRLAKYDRIREVVALRTRVEELEQAVGKLTLENDLLKRGKDH